MGHGSSIPSSQSKKGVVSVQALRAGLRFKAGIGHHDKESTTSQGEGSKEEHDEREQREKKSDKDDNLLSVGGTKVLQNKAIATKSSARKTTKLKKTVASRTSKNDNKQNSKVHGKGKKEKNKIRKVSNAKDQNQSELSLQIANILHGAVDQKCPMNTKLIRIFISSTFTDTEHERNALMERVYPKLKSYCQEKGYEFQVVDMRWGVRDDATDTHETTELCINEIRACQKLSVGPNFITLLAEKYGYCPLPPKIDVTDFEALMNAVPEDDTKELFLNWYRIDHNAIPTSYVLQPVTTAYPEYFSKDDEKRDTSRQQWKEVFLRLKKALVTAVRSVFSDEQKIHLFIRSVSEAEIEEGLLTPSVNVTKCGWLHRKFIGLSPNDQAADNGVISRYIDSLTMENDDVDTGKLLEEFRKRMQQVLDGDNVMKYKVKWTEKGKIIIGAGIDQLITVKPSILRISTSVSTSL